MEQKDFKTQFSLRRREIEVFKEIKSIGKNQVPSQDREKGCLWGILGMSEPHPLAGLGYKFLKREPAGAITVPRELFSQVQPCCTAAATSCAQRDLATA